MKYLASSDGTGPDARRIIVVEADDPDAAMEKAVAELLRDLYDLKYANIKLYNYPEGLEGWTEFRRKMCLAFGEIFEYFEREDIICKNMMKYAQEKIEEFEKC